MDDQRAMTVVGYIGSKYEKIDHINELHIDNEIELINRVKIDKEHLYKKTTFV